MWRARGFANPYIQAFGSTNPEGQNQSSSFTILVKSDQFSTLNARISRTAALNQFVFFKAFLDVHIKSNCKHFTTMLQNNGSDQRKCGRTCLLLI